MNCVSRLAAVSVLTAAVTLAAAPAHAARIGVLANATFNQTAANLGSHLSGHTFTAVDVGAAAPTLGSLTANFDALLLFEDGTFGAAPAVGNVVAAFANTGRPVVLGTFYEQDRTDGPPALTPHGWGALEALDPNVTDGVGTPYAPRALNTATMLAHPLTTGVTALTSAKFAGGNQAKPGTLVVATWTQPNARGQADPAIAYRVTGNACVIHVGIAPSYPTLGTAGVDFGGDFYRVWQNAFDFAGRGCLVGGGAGPNDPNTIPTLSEWGLALTTLLIVAVVFARRRLPTRARARR